MILGEIFKKRIKELVNNEDFQKPISALKKDYTQKGQIILVTKISKLCSTIG